MSSDAAIVCEIIASRAAQAAALAEIVSTCAQDVGQAVTVQTRVVGPVKAPETVLTLHLPVELAASQHQVWCLACRLACFCPAARVSVLVRGESAFGAKPEAVRRRRSA